MGLIGGLFGPKRQRPPHTPVADLVQDYKLLAKVLDELLREIEAEIRPGVKTSRFEAITASFIEATPGLQSSFKGYRGAPFYVTTSVNQEVLNTPPSSRKLEDGDLFKLQVGIKDGIGHSYQSWTYFVGTPRPEDEAFLAAGNEALERAVRLVKVGSNVIEISRAIQTTVEGAGYSINKKYVGHGMGKNQHENPQIPCFVPERADEISHRLRKGQIVSIQVIAHAGNDDCRTMQDDWSVETRDRSRAINLNQIVVATEKGPDVITLPRKSRSP
jgi:methionyl aminopeptidase